MTGLFDTPQPRQPEAKPLEIKGNSPYRADGSVAEHDTGERYYPDGRKRNRWTMPALGPAKPRDFQAEAQAERERQNQRREAKDKPKFEGSRQMAERIDREQQEAETTSTEED